MQCSSKRWRERDREREEKDNIETTKTEKLCRVQSFNRIQQTAPLFISLAVYVRENIKDCCTDVSWGYLVWDIHVRTVQEKKRWKYILGWVTISGLRSLVEWSLS